MEALVSRKSLTIKDLAFCSKMVAIACLVLVAASCTYTLPDEKYFVDIKQTLPNATISLNNFDNKDTIFLYQSANFQYNIVLANSFFIEAGVFLGSTKLSTSTSSKGTFSIDGANLKTGTFQLKIQFTSTSGTGSLADKSGAELAQIWRSWVLIIDVDPPSKPVLRKSVENGFLKISWDPYLKKNFINYTFYYSRAPGYSPTTLVIDKPLGSFYIDSSYVGGSPSHYFISIKTISGSATSSTVSANAPQNVTIKYRSSDSTATLVWRKSNYAGSFKEAVVSENGVKRKVITNPNDTSLVLKLNNVLFGRYSTVSLTINSKYPYAYYQPFKDSLLIDNPVGAKRTEAYQTYYYNKAIGALMAYSPGYGSLRTFDSNMKVIDSIRISSTFSMPYPGNYLYFPSTGGVTQLNLITKATKKYQTKGYYGSYITPHFISGSDNQLVSYSLKDTTYPWDIQYSSQVVDLLSNSAIGSLGLKLSDDGRYAVMNGGMYEIKGGNLNPIGSLYPVYIFRPDNNDELIYLGSPTTILKSSDRTILRTITPPVSEYTNINYDPATKNILYTKYGANKIFLINIDTQKVTTVNASGAAWFINGLLINQDGYYLKIM